MTATTRPAASAPKITVLGTGYLGATHAVCMSALGFDVLAMDVDKVKIDALSSGVLPFYEPGLDTLLVEQLATGRLRFTTSYAEVADFGEVHFIAVGTPQKPGENAADLRYVDAVFEAIAPLLTRSCLLVGKSTVPVGTAERLADRLAELAPMAELAWNPEFLREGFAVEDTLHPDRLVLGVRSSRAEEVLREVYAAPIADGTPVVVTDFATAQLVKVAANSFLATKISFINAMSEVCEAAGGDVTTLADAIGYDSRIGRKFLNAGIGFGGGCLPKDIRAFMARAGELGADQALTFLKEVDAINMRRRARTVDLARELIGGAFLGARVGVLGAAFKPDSDDVRDSPALNVAALMQLQGAQVKIYDPKANANANRVFPTLHTVDSVEEAVKGADVLLHLTEWREFRELDPQHIGTLVSQRNIVDGRNALDVTAWRAAGWTYRSMGRP